MITTTSQSEHPTQPSFHSRDATRYGPPGLDIKMPSRTDIDPEDAAENDSTLAKLKQPRFDPVDFLNETLPSLNLSSQSQTPKTGRSTQIQGAATQSLSLLSSLNTISIRSSSELTSLTDEIIRSGNRLAYEVEVLRGDVNGFQELLTDTLRNDIDQFVGTIAVGGTASVRIIGTDEDEEVKIALPLDEPDFMTRLRLLGNVKARLESVITVFGEAMKWPVPPSEVSGATLISISAPELGVQSTEEDDKASDVLRQIRAETINLMDTDMGHAGLEAALRKVEQYRQLVTLWRGTSEEKARLKFVESLAKAVEDKRRAMEARGTARGARSNSPAQSSGNAQSQRNEGGAAGLFRSYVTGRV